MLTFFLGGITFLGLAFGLFMWLGRDQVDDQMDKKYEEIAKRTALEVVSEFRPILERIDKNTKK